MAKRSSQRQQQDELHITRPMCAPLCVSIDCPQERQRVWVLAANDVGFMLRDLSWEAAATLLRSWRPPVLMVTKARLHRDPNVLRELAIAAGSALVVVSAAAERSHLRVVLRGVLLALRPPLPSCPVAKATVW
ncbi:MAG TPA: hypothetical protein ENK23_07690 [Sorangium sp.]|nr:hypothetical protein [Sorangium sp.]